MEGCCIKNSPKTIWSVRTSGFNYFFSEKKLIFGWSGVVDSKRRFSRPWTVCGSFSYASVLSLNEPIVSTRMGQDLSKRARTLFYLSSGYWVSQKDSFKASVRHPWKLNAWRIPTRRMIYLYTVAPYIVCIQAFQRCLLIDRTLRLFLNFIDNYS